VLNEHGHVVVRAAIGSKTLAALREQVAPYLPARSLIPGVH
jgi:hypothetical protein